MARLTGTKLTAEAFKDQTWIGPLLSSINQLTAELIASFNNSLTISENLDQELKDVTFINEAANFPLKFTAKFNRNPKACQIAYCFNVTDGTTEAITTLPVWSFANGSVSISSITGLTASKKYLIRVHLIYS